MLPDELEKRLDGIEDASKKGYPVRNLYKIACEPGLWLQAYVNIRANAGALTQGVSTDTIDGFSIERAEKLAKTLRSREYGHCCKVSDEAAFCLIQRPYISKTLLTRRISPRGSP
ncbi:hypothetical protein QS958_25235 [Escherichia coli]|nr:hypothetical protein [Escherichia coli]MDL9005281.1 hypothetical protein [Escherichia coli]